MVAMLTLAMTGCDADDSVTVSTEGGLWNKNMTGLCERLIERLGGRELGA